MSFVFSTPAPTAPTAAFGQPPATAAPTITGFGGQPQQSTFGTATSNPPAASGFGGFGIATTTQAQTPAFGFSGGFGTTAASQAPATSNAFGGFGALNSTSLFGGPAKSTAGTSSGFGGFGAPAISTAGTSSGFGGFGAPAISTAGTSSVFGGFGTSNPSFNSSTTTTGGGLFGNNNATGFGLQQQQQQQSSLTKQREQQVYQLLSLIDQETRAQATPAINSEDYKPENVWHALALLKSWWDPKSPSCRFRHYFYNVVSPQEAHLYQKPADHDQAAWDAAQAANPDRTTRVPALAIGFDDVQKRMDEQHKLSEAHSAKLVEIQTMIKEIQKKSQLETAVKLDEYKRKHMQAAQRVIKFLKYAQVLRNKGLSITPDEEVMRARLENIQDQLQRSEQFHGKLSQLWAQLQLIKEQGRQYAKIDGVDGWDAVSEENMSGITKILDEQNNGVQHIIEVLETDTTEVDNLRKGWRAIQ